MSADVQRHAPRGLLPSLTGSQRLILFASVLGAGGAVLWLGPLHDVARANTAVSIPWWVELLACYAASLFFVQINVQRSRSLLSLTEIPVAMGLFLVDPRVLLGSYVVGVLLGHWTRRGLQPAKDYANAMLDVLYMAVTVLVFSAVGPDHADPLAPRSILALAAAMATAGWVVGPLALNVGIYLHQGHIQRGEVARVFLLQAAATTANTSLGIVGLLFMVDRPLLALALLPPVVLVLLGQLAAGENLRRADRMEFLYRTSDLLHSTALVNDRAGELLAGMTRMFGVTRAELLVMPETRGAAVRFVSLGGNERAVVSSSDLTYAEQEALNALRDSRLLTGSQSTPQSPVGLLFAERGASFGIVAGLLGHERPQGMLLLLDPLDGRTRPTVQEESLLLTVAGQISVALENGQLAGAVRTMTAEKDELQRRAFYDPLTQIANRSLFTDTVAKALGKVTSTHRPVATLFIDLDGFKEVNDTHGHAVGDQVLNAVAARLRGQIRKLDMAARLGGDEFGLLLDGMRHRSDVYVVAERVVESLRKPIPVGSDVVSIGGSIGVAVVEHGADIPTAEEVLRRADMAMYLAKRQGKNRYIVFDNGARDPVIAAEMQLPSPDPADRAVPSQSATA